MQQSLNVTPFYSSDVHTFFNSWEIKKHLELRPFLQVPLSFNHKACFDEAMNVLDAFVDHRNYDTATAGKPRWRSVCLRGLDGATDKTLYHADYGVRENPNYQLTSIAERCPQTMAFLESVVDVERCERIRFMLLEPGAKIHVHTDAPNDRSVIALNIALNMPEGCDFFINTRPDGSHSPWTEKIPFTDGAGFLINVANHHYVENRSAQPRIHIIVHGPLRISEPQLHKLARTANNIQNEKQLITRLTLRYAQQRVTFNKELIEEWVKFAVETQEIYNHLRLVILSPSGYPSELAAENTHRITAASLYPLQTEVIAEEHFDSYLKSLPMDDARMLLVLGAGTYVDHFYSFIYEVFSLIGRMQENHVPVAGHILHFADQLPTLHEQCFVLDMSLWRRAGQPLFGDMYRESIFDFSAFTADREHFHDAYTPKALYPALGDQKHSGRGRFATPVLSRFLENGWTIENLPMTLRNEKEYSYFKKPNSMELANIRKKIRKKVETDGANVYCFNNEPLHTTQIPQFRPSTLLSVASGFKPASLAHRHGVLESSLNCVFYDINLNALNYQKALTTCADRKSLLKTIASFNSNPALHKNASDYLDLVVRDAFQDDEQALWNTLKALKSAGYIALDFVSNPMAVVQNIPATEQCEFWHSNAWSNNLVYFLMDREKIENHYTALIAAICEKLKTKAWRHLYYREILFGPQLSDIQMIMTDGVMQGPLQPGLYKEF